MPSLVVEHWYDLNWVEWAGLIGVVLTLVGLRLTWQQARSARTASEAAADAARAVQEQLRAKQLQVHISELRFLTSALDDAIANNESGIARYLLNSWRYSAGHILGILRDEGRADQAILDLVQVSLGMSFTAVQALIGGKKTVAQSSAQAHEAIGTAFDALNQWAGQTTYLVSTEGAP